MTEGLRTTGALNADLLYRFKSQEAIEAQVQEAQTFLFVNKWCVNNG